MFHRKPTIENKKACKAQDRNTDFRVAPSIYNPDQMPCCFVESTSKATRHLTVGEYIYSYVRKNYYLGTKSGRGARQGSHAESSVIVKKLNVVKMKRVNFIQALSQMTNNR
jgi:hypothetical protein